jgi:predicted O-methyltransferase YrrM
MSSQEQWTAVDQYFIRALDPPDPALESALAASDAAGLPPIQVTANQGKLLHLMVRMCGARRILEIGTLGGYSTIWLARALAPGGSLVTLELDEKHAAVARENVKRAGVADAVEVVVGPAIETLPRLAAAGGEPFDFTFIDADKANIAEYFRWSLRLSRVGSVIVFDNVVRKGAVVDADSADPNVRGVRRLVEALAAEPRVTATVIQTVGGKGWDGFAVAVVTAHASI